MKSKRLNLKDLIVVKENEEKEKPNDTQEEIKEYTLNLKEDDESDSLTRVINMRISDTQFKRLRTKAADDNTTVSDFIRGKLFKWLIFYLKMKF